MTMRLGMLLRYHGDSLALAEVLEAERLGYDSVWSGEAYGTDAVTPTFNLMLESVALFDEEVNDFGGTDHTTSVVISPGIRYAFNHPGDAQTVIGIAAPIGVTSDTAEFSIFLYASFEHFFFRPKDGGSTK